MTIKHKKLVNETGRNAAVVFDKRGLFALQTACAAENRESNKVFIDWGRRLVCMVTDRQAPEVC